MMPEVDFNNLLVVVTIAFMAPLLLGLAPRLRLPAVVLEITAGIVAGPQVLGLARPDEVVSILALFGLTMLLFLAGLEVEPETFKGRLLRFSVGGLGASLAIGLAAGLAMAAAGLVRSPLFLAIVLSSTALGLVITVVRDSGLSASPLGQLIIAASSMADFAAVILLSLFFSGESAGTGARLLLLGAFVVMAAVAAASLAGAGRSMSLSRVLVRLQDTSAQIRVRGAVVLLVAFVALAERLGLEVILAAFIAGAVLKLADRDTTTHPNFRLKLEALGYGLFIPIFFVTSGMMFDVRSLIGSPSSFALVPLFLAALLVVRGLPAALLYRRIVGVRHSLVAGFLQATSLPFLVAAAQIGIELEVISRRNGAALVAAGLLSMLVFPAVALAILGDRESTPDPAQA